MQNVLYIDIVEKDDSNPKKLSTLENINPFKKDQNRTFLPFSEKFTIYLKAFDISHFRFCYLVLFDCEFYVLIF